MLGWSALGRHFPLRAVCACIRWKRRPGCEHRPSLSTSHSDQGLQHLQCPFSEETYSFLWHVANKNWKLALSTGRQSAGLTLTGLWNRTLKDSINAQTVYTVMWVTPYALWREYISLSLSLWAWTQLFKLSLPSLQSVTSPSFPVKLKQNNPEKAKSISEALLYKEKRFWTSFWHSNSRALQPHICNPSYTQACAHLPAGAQFLSQSLTTGTHMYIVLPADPSVMTNAHTCYMKHWHTRSLSLFSSLPSMVGIHSTSFPANISSFFLRGVCVGGVFSGQRAKVNQAWGMEKNRSCRQQGGRRKRKGGESRGGVEGERRGNQRRGEERSHIILHLNGNAITSHLIRTVRSTLAGDLLAFISNMNYGSALASKC